MKARIVRSCDGLERRQEERPGLPDDDRQRDQEARVDRQPHRRHERLADREGRELLVARRQLALERPDQVVVEDERDDEPDADRADADEEPLSQLFEVLDERRLLAVVSGDAAGVEGAWPSSRRARFRAAVSAARWCRCVPTGSVPVVWVASGFETPETESLNSRIPVPSDLPISGSRFAPKSSSATSRRPMISTGPMLDMRPA